MVDIVAILHYSVAYGRSVRFKIIKKKNNNKQTKKKNQKKKKKKTIDFYKLVALVSFLCLCK